MVVDIAPAREKQQIKPYENNLYALTHIEYAVLVFGNRISISDIYIQDINI